ncbi:unnamed protein product [Urochloa decumbens]|uniref:DUF3615 domain-containing protein n=1 Tax=Urochloa decumbens TaxID=240449 RepID=A0ABC8W8W8_9POAL
MEEQPSSSSSRRSRRRQGSSADPRREQPEGFAPTPMPVFTVTVDPQGFFHVSPSGGRGPFRSVGEALVATEALLSRRLRSRGNAPVITGPSRQQRGYYMWAQYAPWPWHNVPADPTARIYTRTVPLRPERPRLSPWTVDYYLTLKDGLFHVDPPNNGMGGPFKSLEDATDAIRFDHDWRQEQKERNRKAKEFLDNLDPAVYIACMKDIAAAIRSGKRNPEPENVAATSEPEDCDPDISEEIDRIDRFIERRHAIRNGMKWMQSEVLEAFEFYKETNSYQGPKYEFVKLDRQCLIHDTLSKSYHHYNFTMRRKSSFYLSKKEKRCLKRPSTRGWDYQLFFAEVKSAENGKQVICCPLQSDENGHCFWCQNAGIELRHPESGGYEEGHEDSGFPFDSDSGSED